MLEGKGSWGVTPSVPICWRADARSCLQQDFPRCDLNQLEGKELHNKNIKTYILWRKISWQLHHDMMKRYMDPSAWCSGSFWARCVVSLVRSLKLARYFRPVSSSWLSHAPAVKSTIETWLQSICHGTLYIFFKLHIAYNDNKWLRLLCHQQVDKCLIWFRKHFQFKLKKKKVWVSGKNYTFLRHC